MGGFILLSNVGKKISLEQAYHPCPKLKIQVYDMNAHSVNGKIKCYHKMQENLLN
ncbi:hypothetical protein RO3G_02977 [Rhizopus delemar RA 99-880]|uniref:Uncharacterized protein n=1 Tax=Rhizopus delemar (strain RA 99-880 / ATCC MYA-4621 / FGSC 9543 / NRRL 43880) TaxID=246409 RepID=I1BPZ3_RHIO9|nr:hypothetical protein RO3G_02977 [Rhizopus delemar RA 99-880]|eukprot:EIE78273.1 hypothetical protein RO3G_02977 [Rhizopus delemar RA 99-880]